MDVTRSRPVDGPEHWDEVRKIEDTVKIEDDEIVDQLSSDLDSDCIVVAVRR